MEHSKDITDFQNKVDEKEKMLIHEISENVAAGIQDELGESLDDLLESVRNADSSISQIGNIAQKLSSSMEAIQGYDFSEKISELQTAQDMLNSALNNTKTVLDEGKSAGEQFINNSANALMEWTGLKAQFTETVKQAMDQNRTISGNLSELGLKIEELDSLQKRLNETLRLLDEKFSDQTDRKIMEITDELRKENQSMSTQLSIIQQQFRTSPTMISLAVMEIIIIVLQIVSFFG